MLQPGAAALVTIGFIVYFGYLGSIGKAGALPSMMANFVYIFPAVIAVNIDLLPCPSLLVPAGRKQKFYAMLASAIVLTFLGVILFLALTGISILLQGRLPDINWRGLELSYHALNLRLLPLFVVFIPVPFCMNIFFRKNHMMRMIITIGLVQTIVVAGVTSSLSIITFGPVSLVMIAFGLWALFVYVLHHVCTRRSLVTQSG